MIALVVLFECAALWRLIATRRTVAAIVDDALQFYFSDTGCMFDKIHMIIVFCRNLLQVDSTTSRHRVHDNCCHYVVET